LREAGTAAACSPLSTMRVPSVATLVSTVKGPLASGTVSCAPAHWPVAAEQGKQADTALVKQIVSGSVRQLVQPAMSPPESHVSRPLRHARV
jgi:hypothetical protein